MNYYIQRCYMFVTIEQSCRHLIRLTYAVVILSLSHVPQISPSAGLQLEVVLEALEKSSQ